MSAFCNDFLPQAGSADMAVGSGGTGNGSIDSPAVCSLSGHIKIDNPYTVQGKRLDVGDAEKGILIDGGHEGNPYAIGQFPIGLVGNNVNGMVVLLLLLAEKGSQLFQSLPGVDNTGGIVGRI